MVVAYADPVHIFFSIYDNSYCEDIKCKIIYNYSKIKTLFRDIYNKDNTILQPLVQLELLNIDGAIKFIFK